MSKRRTLLVTATGLAAGTALAACGSGAGTTQWNPSGGSSGSAGASAKPAEADITITPAGGANNVLPTDNVVVTASGGILQSVTVVAGGKSLAGQLDADQKTWRSTGKLSYGATYTVTATLSGVGASPSTKTSTFTTVRPTKQVTATLQANALAALQNGGTYGVGQPICVGFSSAPADKDAAVKAIDVQIDPPVEIRWHWIDNKTVHARPEKYWAPGTKITININLFGVNLGRGLWGKANNSGHFTIGPSQIAIADSNTHYMKVYVNGKQVKNMPCSMGKGGTRTGANGETVNFWTNSGVHVVLAKQSTYRMTSASFGITDKSDPNWYDEVIDMCCRISYSGEFTHSAPWSVADQGKRNVSHGCINLSPANAKWIYDNFRLGDIVQVLHTPRQLELWNGLGDWNTPWSKW
jgi:lipoprotein-anchoring transpeptidase ErfK/SrfK